MFLKKYAKPAISLFEFSRGQFSNAHLNKHMDLYFLDHSFGPEGE